MEEKKHGTDWRRESGVKKTQNSRSLHRSGKPSSKYSTGKTQQKRRVSESSASDDSTEDSNTVSPRYSFSTEIPERYNETYIAAIPKDPHYMYVYWEFSEDTRKMMDTDIDQIGSKLILRVKDTESSGVFEDVLPYHVEVNDYQDEYFLRIPEHGKEYLVECGHISQKGDFVPIAQSVPVSIPETQSFQPYFDSMLNMDEMLLKEFDEHAAYSSDKSNPAGMTGGCSSQTCDSLSKSNPGSTAFHSI